MTGDPFTIGAIYRSADGIHQEPFIGTTIGHLQNRAQGASMLPPADAPQGLCEKQKQKKSPPHLQPLQTL